MLIPGTKKEDFLEGKFAYPGDKEEGLPGVPVCLSRGQRRRTSWSASLLIPGTKKEDFLEGQFSYPGTKKEDFLEGSLLIRGTKKEDYLEGSVMARLRLQSDKQASLK